MFNELEVMKYSFLVGLSFSSGVAFIVALYNQIVKK